MSISSAGTGTNELKFTFKSTWTVKCRPVGIGSAPEQAATSAITNDGESGTQINPSFDSGVIYRSASVQNKNKDTVDISFENRGSEAREMVEARLSFYSADGQGGGGGNSGLESAEFGGGTLQYLGAYNDGISVQFDADEQKTASISFNCAGGNDYVVGSGDYFVLSVILDNGESNTYFIAPSGGKSGSGGCKNN